MKGLTNS